MFAKLCMCADWYACITLCLVPGNGHCWTWNCVQACYVAGWTDIPSSDNYFPSKYVSLNLPQPFDFPLLWTKKMFLNLYADWDSVSCKRVCVRSASRIFKPACKFIDPFSRRFSRLRILISSKSGGF